MNIQSLVTREPRFNEEDILRAIDEILAEGFGKIGRFVLIAQVKEVKDA